MRYIIVLTGYFVFSFAHAQENTSSDATQASSAEVTQATERPDNEETAPQEESNQPNFDVFRPSEDISEDLAVPFPVDI